MLTQEEARMASAQRLIVANTTTNNRVGEIANNVLGVDNSLGAANIGDQIQGVDDQPKVVMDGTQYTSHLLS